MKIVSVSTLAVLVAAGALSTANAQTVLNTDLPDANGVRGAGVATTTTTPNGTTTTDVGPSGDANRFYQTTVPGTWQQQAVGGGGTVGITKTYSNDGNGAAFLSTTSSASKGDLEYVFDAPVLLSDLTSMSFDFYRDGALSTTGDIFAPTMRLIMSDNDAFAGYLVSEYYYQNNTNPPADTWVTQSSTLTSGQFWATSSLLGPTFAAANGGVKTLQDWIDGNSGETLKVVGVNFGVGSGWSGTFSGAVDHVQYSFANGPSANFDFAVAGVPEPAAWATMLLGFLGVGAVVRGSRRRRAIA